MPISESKLDRLELLWIRKALETQRASMVRAVAKEVPGSEIEVLRRKEIAQLDALIVKVA